MLKLMTKVDRESVEFFKCQEEHSKLKIWHNRMQYGSVADPKMRNRQTVLL